MSPKGIFYITCGGRDYLFHESLSALTEAPSIVLSGNKYLCNRYLKSKGFNVPDALELHCLEDALHFLKGHSSIVLKPLKGEGGEGVVVNISSKEELASSYEHTVRMYPHLYVEEMIHGHDVRILVIDDQVSPALHRVPAYIMGDGKGCVASLIQQREKILRQKDAHVSIPLGGETCRVLKKQGVGIDDIIPFGKKITIRLTANFHTGGSIHNVTDNLSSFFKECAVNIAKAVSMPVVGIDLCIPDFAKDDYYIFEINERPNLAFHMYPETGMPINTAYRFVDFFLHKIQAHLNKQ